MTALTRRLPRFIAALVGLVALLLTGCKIDGTVEFQADGSTKIDLTFEDSDGLLAKIHQTCEGLRLSIKAEMTFIKNPKVEDITSPGGHLTCRLTSNEALGGNVRFSENKDTYSFILPSMEISEDYSDFKTRIIVTMPGNIIKTNRGRIDGNKVIIDNFDFFTRGTSITSKKTQDAADSSAGSSGGRSGVSSSSVSGGFPAWGWVGVAAATVVVAVVVFIAGHKRRAAAGAEPAVQQGLPPRGQGPRPH